MFVDTFMIKFTLHKFLFNYINKTKNVTAELQAKLGAVRAA